MMLDDTDRLSEIMSGIEVLGGVPGSGLDPSSDPDLWVCLRAVIKAAREQDTKMAPWLAGLTQFEEPGPMGRALLVSELAIEALRQMPSEALREAERLASHLGPEASPFSRIGVIRVAKVSGLAEAHRVVALFFEDEDRVVRDEAIRAAMMLLPGKDDQTD